VIVGNITFLIIFAVSDLLLLTLWINCSFFIIMRDDNAVNRSIYDYSNNFFPGD